MLLRNSQENLPSFVVKYYLHNSFYDIPGSRALFLSLVSQNKETEKSQMNFSLNNFSTVFLSSGYAILSVSITQVETRQAVLFNHCYEHFTLCGENQAQD